MYYLKESKGWLSCLYLKESRGSKLSSNVQAAFASCNTAWVEYLIISYKVWYYLIIVTYSDPLFLYNIF